MIEDCKVFRTFADDTPEELAEEIRLELKYVGRLFLFCRLPVHLPNLKRLNFGFDTGSEGPMAVEESIFPDEKHKGGLCVIRYDAKRHRSLTKEERYLNIMDLLENGTKPYASRLGLDMSFFDKTFRRMRVMGFGGCGFILDPVKSSKDKKFKASMEVEIVEKQNTFNIVFLDKTNNVFKRVLTRSKKVFGKSDHSFTLFASIGRWRWLSNEDFVLSNMDATWSWIASPYRDGFEFVEWTKERGYLNKPYGNYSIPRLVVWDEFWKMKGLE
jgi:hypothetical protein